MILFILNRKIKIRVEKIIHSFLLTWLSPAMAKSWSMVLSTEPRFILRISSITSESCIHFYFSINLFSYRGKGQQKRKTDLFTIWGNITAKFSIALWNSIELFCDISNQFNVQIALRYKLFLVFRKFKTSFLSLTSNKNCFSSKWQSKVLKSCKVNRVLIYFGMFFWFFVDE